MKAPPELLCEMRRLVLVERTKIETVARRFGVHHSVVRRALREACPEAPPKTESVLDPFKPFIIEQLGEHPQLTATRLYAELKSRGYLGGIATVRRFVARVRTRRPRKAFLRVEFEPAEQAQVDWGSFGHWRIGASQRPLSCFAMVLSWSRALYLDFALDQRMETFLQMHRRALEFFGGVPRKVVYDNLKSVVLHHIGQTVQFNPRFLAFAGHYLFEPIAAPVRYPQFKGRVESSIKYIRHSFFYGRSFSSFEDLQEQAARWRDETANQRLHSTTRERPAERMLIEKSRLRALPQHPFDTDLLIATVVSNEARVWLDTNSYSLPPALVGRDVFIRAEQHSVSIVCDGQQVARHQRCWQRRCHIELPEHRAQMLEQRPAAQQPSRRERLASFSPQSRQYLQEVARRRINLQSEVRKLLRLCDLYGDSELASGMARALAARTFGARYVRAHIDQSRFERGLGEPAELIVTGNPTADALDVEPHPMESYDALFDRKRNDDTDPDSDPV